MQLSEISVMARRFYTKSEQNYGSISNWQNNSEQGESMVTLKTVLNPLELLCV